MPLHKLALDDFNEDPYILIAVHCRLEDYRLAYVLNKNLGSALMRQPENLDFNHLSTTYSIFEWINNSQYNTWHLVSNVCKIEEDILFEEGTLFSTQQRIVKTSYLISNQRKVDYFIKITNEIQHIDVTLLTNKLQSIPEIITSYPIDPIKLKPKDNLIF